MIHLYTQQKKSKWSYGSFQGTMKIWFKNTTTQMSIFKEKDSMYGIRISS